MNKRIFVVVLTGLFSCNLSASPCSEALIAGKFDEALQQGEKDNSHDGHVCAARAMLAKGSAKDALRHLDLSEKLAQTAYEKMLTATYQGRAAKALGDIDSAIHHFEQAVTLASESRQKQAQWFNLNEIGQIQLDHRSAQTSLETFVKAYSYAANDNERAESNRLIASAHKALGDINRAIEYQLKATLLEKRSGELADYLDALLELADLRLSNKEFAAAEKNVKEALGITSQAQSDYWSARAYYALARLELMRGDSGAFGKAIAEAKQFAGNTGSKELIEKVDNLKE